MSRHRFCMTSDRDGFIEELAQQLWEEKHAAGSGSAWGDADAQQQQEFRNLASDTARFLEHGHG